MIRWLICALALILFAAPAAAPAAEEPQVEVTVSRGANGDWLVDYRFGLRSPVWFFPRSSNDGEGKSWRVQSWTVETPGVTLRRVGAFDALDGGGKPLTRVRIRMRPWSDQLPRDFTPAVRFSDGSLAFLSDNFTAIPLATVAQVRALPADLDEVTVHEPAIRLAFHDPDRRLLLRGTPSTGSASLLMASGNTYVYAGDTPVLQARGFAGVLDAGLPAWIRSEVVDFTPRLLEHYRAKLGTPRDGKLMAMVAWGGRDQSGWLLNARVLDGMIMLQIAGASATWRTSEKADTLRTFIGHETAHFWLGRTLETASWRDRWITEGGADFMATRALETLEPGYDGHREWRRLMNDCLDAMRGGGSLASVGGNGRSMAYYDCGALLWLAAEHAAKQRDPRADSYEFYRGLGIAAGKDRMVDAALWFRRFEQVTRNRALAEEVRGFVQRGVPDTQAFFRRLFKATGVPLAVEEIPLKELLKT